MKVILVLDVINRPLNTIHFFPRHKVVTESGPKNFACFSFPIYRNIDNTN